MSDSPDGTTTMQDLGPWLEFCDRIEDCVAVVHHPDCPCYEALPVPEPETRQLATDLGEALEQLHEMGAWLAGWYTLGDGRFECRVRTPNSLTWAVDVDPLVALRQCITEIVEKGLPTPPPPTHDQLKRALRDLLDFERNHLRNSNDDMQVFGRLIQVHHQAIMDPL